MSLRNFFLCALLLMAGYANGQTVGDPTASPGEPASTYALGNIGNFNYYNGLHEVTIPLVTIGGRGSANLPISISVQQQWSVTVSAGVFSPVQGPTPSISPGGFITVQYLSSKPGQCTSNGQRIDLGPFVSYLLWNSPDGTQTILKDIATNGQPKGSFSQCAELNGYAQFNRGRIFRATDGSDLVFVADQDVIDESFAKITGVLVSRDGTKTRSGIGYTAQVEDRNGNDINVANPTPGSNFTITDPINRTTTISNSTITYPGFNNALRSVSLSYAPLQNVLATGESLQTPHCLFPELNGASNSSSFNPQMLSSVTLANGSQYSMLYNSYGELAKLTLPTGAYYTYRYKEASCQANNGSGVVALDSNSGYRILRPLQERDEYADGSTLSGKVVIKYGEPVGPDGNHPSRINFKSVADFESANGDVLRREMHYFYGNPLSTAPPPSDPLTFAKWWEGLEYQKAIADGADHLSQIQQSVFTQRPCDTVSNEPCWFTPGDDSAPAHDPQVCQVQTTLVNGGGAVTVSGILYGHDRFNNVSDMYEYNFGSQPALGPSCAQATGTPMRHTQTTYLAGTNISTATNLVSLAAQVRVFQGTTIVKNTKFGYDQFPIANAPSIIGHNNTTYADNTLPRANLTSINRCKTLSDCSTAATQTMHYDIAGNLVSVTDGNNHTTSYDYSDAANTYAHVTKTTDALGQITTSSYDLFSGKITLASDLNNVNTTFNYTDSLDRLTQIRRAAGGNSSQESRTTFSYPNSTETITTQDQTATGDGLISNQTLYDGLGRPIQTDQSEGLASSTVETKMTYDALGRMLTAKTPYRTSAGANGSTTYQYDNLNRVNSITAPDGSITSTTPNGNQVIATDAAGKQRVLLYDAAGRLTAVTEYSGSSPSTYQTNYAYDVLDHLTNVTQGSCDTLCLKRSFIYDALGRLQQATNPESGSVTYSYDDADNLLTMTNANHVTTTYGYDVLNRLISRKYSDGTASESWTWLNDNSIPYGRGHLANMDNGLSRTNYLGYDALGRIAQSTQQTNGQTYPFSYQWNLADQLKSETYPSGRVLTTSYERGNRPVGVQGQLPGGTAVSYAASGSYGPQGGLSQLTLGNGIVRSYTYTAQGQPATLQELVNNDPAQQLLGFTWNWGTTNNNGTLKSLAMQAKQLNATTSLSLSQTYSYDGVNRLTSVSETGGGGHTYGYDAYGNAWLAGTSSSWPASSVMPVTGSAFDEKNRLLNGSYDAAGNLRSYGQSSQANTLAYDAKGQLIQVTAPPSLGAAYVQYLYDAAGERVSKRFSSGATTTYVYDALGQLASEYSNATQGGAVACSTCYLSTDHLGSTRMVTNSSAQVIARHDFDPFGLEIPAGYAGRTGEWGAADGVRQQFTGQERDSESGLDYFNARYFASALGRFHSPDPGNAGANPADPQSWNGYSYVRGTPTSLTDPSGLNPCQGNFACLSQIGICQTDPTVCQQADFFNSDPLQGALNSFDPFNLLNDGQIGIEGTREVILDNFLNSATFLNVNLQPSPSAPSNVCSEDGPQIVRDASVNALSRLNPAQDESSNITPRDGNFANVANPGLINTNTWTNAASAHGSSLQSPTIPGQNIFVVKLYNDPNRGNIIAVVYPNGTAAHLKGLIPFIAGSTSVNVPAARNYLGCTGRPQ